MKDWDRLAPLDSKKSVSWCVNCEESLCTNCAENHRAMKISRSHHLI
jgi:hypothetical protein